MTQQSIETLIHVGKILGEKGKKHYLLLRKVGPHEYEWFLQDSSGDESPTNLIAPTPQSAILLGRKKWKLQDFRTLNCGFRYTLPERDEHGMNALFHEMVASLSTPNGVYFDEERGYNCYVQASSIEAVNFWKKFST